MPEFCEYMGGLGGVCMREQASQHQDDELLHYCETHLALVQRERASRRRMTLTARELPSSSLRDGVGPRHLHAQRSRSEPYLGRSTIQWPCDRSGRIVIMDDSITDKYVPKNHWSRAGSSPARITEASAITMLEANAIEDTMAGTTISTANTTAIEEAVLAMRTTTPSPRPEQVRRKRVRVKTIVVPSRFEEISGSPSSPPYVWYARVGERTTNDGSDKDLDEFIEINEQEFGHSRSPDVSVYGTSNEFEC